MLILKISFSPSTFFLMTNKCDIVTNNGLKLPVNFIIENNAHYCLNFFLSQSQGISKNVFIC